MDSRYAGFVYGVEYEFNTIESLLIEIRTLEGDPCMTTIAPIGMPCVWHPPNRTQIMIPVQEGMSNRVVNGISRISGSWTLQSPSNGFHLFRRGTGSHPRKSSETWMEPCSTLWIGKCGSLPCPPYQDNWELTCVVCTQIISSQAPVILYIFYMDDVFFSAADMFCWLQTLTRRRSHD